MQENVTIIMMTFMDGPLSQKCNAYRVLNIPTHNQRHNTHFTFSFPRLFCQFILRKASCNCWSNFKFSSYIPIKFKKGSYLI
jgi:hypothetical protein